jgi:hypothetical protein
MAYVVSAGGTDSDLFKSLMGVLIGDPCSPTLWNIFLSDFSLPPDPDDLVLDGIRISHLEHADDIIIISTSATGLQTHLCALHRWCSLTVNAIKSWCMIFGELPEVMPVFTLAGEPVPCAVSHPYVGIVFRSGHCNIFTEIYTTKATKARSCGHAIFGMETVLGRNQLPSREGKHCTWRGSILRVTQLPTPDIDDRLLHLLEDVQHSFLRRLLHVNSQSMLAPLYTETGILPLRYRRIILTLRYLGYLVSLPFHHYAKRALSEQQRLRTLRRPCWLTDIEWTLASLAQPLPLPPLHLLDDDGIARLSGQVRQSSLTTLQQQINDHVQTYLLHDRKEPRADAPP